MKYKWLHVIAVLVIISTAVWGMSKRQSYTDITSKEDFMEQMVVAELPEDLAQGVCEELEKVLLEAPIVLRVSSTEDMKYSFLSGIQYVLVKDVYEGEKSLAGQRLCLNFGRWSIVLTEKYNTMQCGFVNVMKENEDYLVFLGEPYEGLGGELIYPFWGDTYVVPMFCYTDSENLSIPIKEELPTYVPYISVRNNEFFATSDSAIEELEELKESMLDKYPNSVNVFEAGE